LHPSKSHGDAETRQASPHRARSRRGRPRSCRRFVTGDRPLAASSNDLAHRWNEHAHRAPRRALTLPVRSCRPCATSILLSLSFRKAYC
jgi:hypothetical protein